MNAKIPIEISLGALLLAGLLPGAAMAQTKEKEFAPPPAQVPATPQNRTGLPPAPAERDRLQATTQLSRRTK